MTIIFFKFQDLKPIKKLTGHFGYVVDILWLGTKDSARLASASADGTVKIWNTDKSECLMTLQEGRLNHFLTFPVSF